MLKKENFVKGKISVVLPIFGEFDLKKIYAVIESLLLQKRVELEIIVSEQGQFSRFNSKFGDKVKHIFQKLDSEDSPFNISKMRNEGIKSSTGEYIYNTDADVFPLNPYFFLECKKILEKNQSLILRLPKKKRLPLDDINSFFEMLNDKGMQKTIDSLNLNNPFLATINNKIREVEYIKKKDEFGDIRNYTSIKDLEKESFFEDIFETDVHWAGMFFRKNNFFNVGGFCEQFENWGMDDVDLYWKFSFFYKLVSFPKKKLFNVIHLDHKRGYFSKEKYIRNREISKKRQKEGIIKSLYSDRLILSKKKKILQLMYLGFFLIPHLPKIFLFLPLDAKIGKIGIVLKSKNSNLYYSLKKLKIKNEKKFTRNPFR